MALIQLIQFSGILLALLLSVSAADIKASSAFPAAAKGANQQTFFGEQLADPYQWLEAANSPETRSWTEAENRVSEEYFARLAARKGILEQFRQTQIGKTVGYQGFIFAGKYVYAERREPPRAQPAIVRRSLDDLNGTEETVFDPGKFDPSGHTACDWYVPSPDGALVALSLSKNGSEDGELRFLRTADGKLLEDVISRVQFATAGGSAAWDPDGKGLYYTRYPRPGERPEEDQHFFQQVYHHVLGTAEDVYAIGRDFPKIAEIQLERSPGGHWILATVANGDGGQYALQLCDEHGHWTELAGFAEGIKQAVFGGDGALYLRRAAGESRGEVWRLDLSSNPLDGRDKQLIVPEKEDSAIEAIAATDTFLLVNDTVGGPSRLRRFDGTGKEGTQVALPENSAVTDMTSDGESRVLVSVSSYLEPLRQFLATVANPDLQPTPFDSRSGVSFADIAQKRAFVESKDGTKVPLSVLAPKGTAWNGSAPLILYGYGGYGLSSEPHFDPFLRAWFDRGGAFVVANVRGGGEYGEPWHRAGMLEKKQNTLDDFAACAEYLVREKYTDPAHLGVWGISNGGITAGGILTQHPDLMRAAVLQVGVLDVVRSENEPNGAFNVTEYGTVKDPAQYRAIRAYSPYQNVREGTGYPAVLLLAGENDHRVASWHAKKMTARLQAATTSDHPILLRTSATAGHGMGTSFDERLQLEADVFSFFADQLGAGER